MSDDALRASLREWRASPGDREALERALNEHRRAGLPIPGYLSDARRFPARTFAAPWSFEAVAILPGTEYQPSNRLSLSSWKAGFESGETKSCELPESLFWWVRPKQLGKHLPAVLEDLRAEGVPGLDLTSSRTSDAAVASLQSLDQLEALKLVRCASLTGTALLALPPRLRYLDLGACKGIRDRGWEGLAKCPELTHLRTSRSMKGAGLARVSRAAPRLTHLTLRGKGFGNAALAPLEELGQLEELSLSGSGFSRAGVPLLGRLPLLKRLSVTGCIRLTDKAIPELVAACPGLTHLDLEGVPLNDASYAYASLGGLPALRHLSLGRTSRAAREGVLSLSTHPTLETLSLIGPQSLLEAFPPRIQVRVP